MANQRRIKFSWQACSRDVDGCGRTPLRFMPGRDSTSLRSCESGLKVAAQQRVVQTLSVVKLMFDARPAKCSVHHMHRRDTSMVTCVVRSHTHNSDLRPRIPNTRGAPDRTRRTVGSHIVLPHLTRSPHLSCPVSLCLTLAHTGMRNAEEGTGADTHAHLKHQTSNHHAHTCTSTLARRIGMHRAMRGS